MDNGAEGNKLRELGTEESAQMREFRQNLHRLVGMPKAGNWEIGWQIEKFLGGSRMSGANKLRQKLMELVAKHKGNDGLEMVELKYNKKYFF